MRRAAVANATAKRRRSSRRQSGATQRQVKRAKRPKRNAMNSKLYCRSWFTGRRPPLVVCHDCEAQSFRGNARKRRAAALLPPRHRHRRHEHERANESIDPTASPLVFKSIRAGELLNWTNLDFSDLSLPDAGELNVTGTNMLLSNLEPFTEYIITVIRRQGI